MRDEVVLLDPFGELSRTLALSFTMVTAYLSSGLSGLREHSRISPMCPYTTWKPLTQVVHGAPSKSLEILS